ncbi:MAG TPA: glycosyltransferase family 1 protein [Mycobacteriales bacterium]|nr:glycosyltransferase family 1 protein [Mycobacteriales bacterium]HVX69820.1 glycosyltransferase family 1 protein [Mycobacteriales bacterium]
MSLVVDGRFLSGRATGLHRVARGFVAAAKEAGVDLEVWTPGRVDDPLADRALRVPGGRLGGRLWEQVILPAAAARHTIWSLTNTAPLARPGIVVVHDLAATVGPEWFAGSMRLYAHSVLTSARRAKHVITVSRAVRSELVAHGVGEERITVVSPAVDGRFAPAPSADVERLRASLGLDAEYVVMVGWADPRKDVATAVAAHERTVGELPHDLVLVGSGHPTFAPVPRPSGERIKIVGHASDPDLVALLTGAKALLYPSRYEGFGLPPLEAMACGTPAIVSDIPALRESTAGSSARLVAPEDAEGWAAALREGLSGTLTRPSPPTRSWQSVGAELAASLPAGSDARPNR